MQIKSYKELTVWKKSVVLVEEVYCCTAKLPKEELYGLVMQARRAVVSIPSSIAEGSRRKNGMEYLQYIRIADGSSAELETQLIIIKRLYPHVNVARAEQLLDEVQRMLHAMRRTLESKIRLTRTPPSEYNDKE
ncbi:MAG: four helix bundle protein [Candidatus Liptonbacteria bacterium]|nr:four helix bundle protein [Candidatus Liptonbacteria bacterium]MBI3114511.1 four helix bundle protein [Candidatus Harrisonbacteria bacterium]